MKASELAQMHGINTGNFDGDIRGKYLWRKHGKKLGFLTPM